MRSGKERLGKTKEMSPPDGLGREDEGEGGGCCC